MDKDKLISDLKELDDIEFEVVFIDKVYKKLKAVLNSDSKSPTLLLVYMGILDTLRSYVSLAKETDRTIPYDEIVDLIIHNGDEFLSSVAADESKYMYVMQSLSKINNLVKDLMLLLKIDLMKNDKYEHLRIKIDEEA